MIHMLTGNLMSRSLSLGSVGITVVMGKGPKKPLVAQNTLACPNAVPEHKTHNAPTSTATIPCLLFIRAASSRLLERLREPRRLLDRLHGQLPVPFSAFVLVLILIVRHEEF